MNPISPLELDRQIGLLPAGHVLVVRNSPKFRRSLNGAWLGNGSDVTTHVVPEANAIAYVNGSGRGFVTVYWKDGHVESVDSFNDPIRLDVYGTGAETETEILPAIVDQKTGKVLCAAWTSVRPKSRMGKKGYYCMEACT